MLVLAPTMDVPRADQSIEKLFLGIAVEPSHGRSALEYEVTALFDDLRCPVLRYLLSFGLSLQDAEEVSQEVILSLVLHLRGDKPRSNIRAWIFRVAHNLGLKRRETNHRMLKVVANADECSVELLVDTAPDPEQQITSMQSRQRLLAIV